VKHKGEPDGLSFQFRPCTFEPVGFEAAHFRAMRVQEIHEASFGLWRSSQVGWHGNDGGLDAILSGI